MSKTKRKKKYERPKVRRIGKLEKLTQAKRGAKADGAGKPATRLNGLNS